MIQKGDLVLTHIKDKPAFFARIEDIGPDIKPGWFQVRMLVLQVPLITITWILRETYISGEEFTMGGHPVRLAKVVAPEASNGQPEGISPEFDEVPSLDAAQSPDEQPPDQQAPRPSATDSARPTNVVSLADRRKKSSD